MKLYLTIGLILSLFAVPCFGQNTSPFPASGNVGIGTNNPTAPLSFGSTLFNTKIALWELNGLRYGLGIQAFQFRLHLSAPDARFSFLSDEVGSTELMTIQGTGNVGIGTASPQANLEIKKSVLGGLGPVLRLTGGGGAGAQCAIDLANYEQGTQLPSCRITSSDDGNFGSSLDFQTKETGANANALKSRLFIKADGSVGIGTTSPQAMLAVNGEIASRKVRVTQTGWADYVFNKTYRLRPLSEVEQYIALHHHLPEVPSAAEVEKDGVDLGDSQATLLKKIEELTLYIIDLNKQMEALKKEISQQKSAPAK